MISKNSLAKYSTLVMNRWHHNIRRNDIPQLDEFIECFTNSDALPAKIYLKEYAPFAGLKLTCGDT
jgi:hypothetical protein